MEKTMMSVLESKLATLRKEAPAKNEATIAKFGTLGYKAGSLAGRAVLGGQAAYEGSKLGYGDRKSL